MVCVWIVFGMWSVWNVKGVWSVDYVDGMWIMWRACRWQAVWRGQRTHGGYVDRKWLVCGVKWFANIFGIEKTHN